jgi:hypothetical protein
MFLSCWIKNKKYLSDLKDFQVETNCTPSHSTMHGNIALGVGVDVRRFVMCG